MFVKVTGAGQASKPSVWIDAGIHAREWISHATALYFIDRVNFYNAMIVSVSGNDAFNLSFRFCCCTDIIIIWTIYSRE